MIEIHFDTNNLSFFTDIKGEFKGLDSDLSHSDIKHLSTTPNTPERVSLAKCQHRHIVEISETLLHDASLSLNFGLSHVIIVSTSSIVFHPLTYIIKLCSNNYIVNDTIIENIGFLNYPWLNTYSKNKHEQKSTPCVYLRFFLSHHCL